MAGLIIGAVALGVKKYDEHKEKKEKKRIELNYIDAPGPYDASHSPSSPKRSSTRQQRRRAEAQNANSIANANAERQVRRSASSESSGGEEVPPPSYEDAVRTAEAQNRANGVRVESRRV